MRPSARATPACSGARRGTRYQKPQPPSARHKMTENAAPRHERPGSQAAALVDPCSNHCTAPHRRLAQPRRAVASRENSSTALQLGRVLLGLGARNQLTDIMKLFISLQLGGWEPCFPPVVNCCLGIENEIFRFDRGKKGHFRLCISGHDSVRGLRERFPNPVLRANRVLLGN